jgi:sarcosine oxidase subunit beta
VSEQDVIVVGAGILGVATAYHLAKRRAGRILVLDAHGPGAGATGRSGAMVRSALATAAETRLAVRSIETFRTFDDAFGTAGAFTQVGMIATGAGDGARAATSLAVQQAEWGSSIRSCTREEVGHLCPRLSLDADEHLHFDPSAGVCDPHVVLSGYVLRSRELGVRFESDARVDVIQIADGRVTGVVCDGLSRAAGHVVVTAGAWSRRLLAGADIDLGLVPRMSRVAVFRPGEPGLETPIPIVMDGPQEAWFRPMPGGAVLVGAQRGGRTGVDPDRVAMAVPDEILDAYLAVLRRRFRLEAPVHPRGGWAGVYMLSPDGRPFVGPAPGVDGLFLAVGDHGGAFKIAPALGEGLADLMTEPDAGSVDLTEFAPNRLALRAGCSGRACSRQAMLRVSAH